MQKRAVGEKTDLILCFRMENYISFNYSFSIFDAQFQLYHDIKIFVSKKSQNFDAFLNFEVHLQNRLSDFDDFFANC